MNETELGPANLIDTTDCLEAVEVFRGWKNFLFVLTILLMLMLQLCFWLVNTGYVKTDEQNDTTQAAAVKPKKSEIQQAAEKVTAEEKTELEDPNQQDQTPTQKAENNFKIEPDQISKLIRILNFVLIPTAVLYCLTLLFGLKVSLVGRLGGINHAARAFFLALIAVVLLLPWQKFFAGIVVGAMFSPEELLDAAVAEKTDILSNAVYYLRFIGYWLLVMSILILSQVRGARWARAILRRLEVI